MTEPGTGPLLNQPTGPPSLLAVFFVGLRLFWSIHGFLCFASFFAITSDYGHVVYLFM